MKTLILTALLSLSLSSLPSFAGDAPLSREHVLKKLNGSATLAGVQAGVRKDFGMAKCSKFELDPGYTGQDTVEATSYCSFQDEEGNEGAVVIDVNAEFYDANFFILKSIAFHFAG